MYKSLFERLKNYSSNPIDEYYKISSLLDEAIVDNYYQNRLYTFLSDAFLYCEELRGYYTSLDSCIEENCSNLNNSDYPAKSYYQSLSEEEQDVLLDEFLTYCQILLTCLSYLNANANAILSKHFCNIINKEIVNQFTELILYSLKSFNYKCVLNKGCLNVEIAMINPVAEVIALESSENVHNAIMGFLSNRDIKTKEKYLHDFVDLLEPTIKTYSDQSLVKKIKEYVQLLRHPETKKEEIDYKWYFNNKRKYIDKLFELSLFIQQYDLSKQIVDEFEKNKKAFCCN